MAQGSTGAARSGIVTEWAERFDRVSTSAACPASCMVQCMDVEMISATGRQGRDQQACRKRFKARHGHAAVRSLPTEPLRKLGIFPNRDLA